MSNEVKKVEKVVKKDAAMDVSKLVNNTNKAADNVVKAQVNLFKVVRECVAKIGDDKKALNAYKKGIKQSHRSTIFVMMKVAQNSFLTTHQAALPAGYQTLYECLKLVNEVGEELMSSLIEEGHIHNESTKANITDLRKKNAVITKAETETGDVKVKEEGEKGEVISVSVDDATRVITSLGEKERLEVVISLVPTLTKAELEIAMREFELALSTFEEAELEEAA